MNKRASTLHLTPPLGQTVGRAVVILLLLVGLLEGVCRIPAVTERLPAPSLGSNKESLEIKLHVLDTLAADAPIDCIFVGSSVVHRAIDPARFAEVYQSRTGDSIRCFNLGVGGMVPTAVLMLVEYLFDTYHPGLIVYGLTPRAFTPAGIERGVSGTDLADMSWMRYQRGSFNLEGWLLSHSRAFGYMRAVSNWMLPEFADQIKLRRQEEADWTADLGQRVVDPVYSSLAAIYAPQKDPRYTEFFDNFDPVPGELAGFQALVSLHHPPDRQIVVVEIPLHDVLLNDYIGREAYEQLNNQLAEWTGEAGVPFRSLTQLNLLAENDWQDPSHVNIYGAEKISVWLGKYIGKAVNEGRLVDPTH